MCAYLTRKAFRQDVVARLKASTDEPLASLASARIYDTRGNPAQQDEGVTIAVYTPRQLDKSISRADPQHRIRSSLYIEIAVEMERDESTDLADLDAAAAGLADDYAHAIKLTLFEDPIWVKQFEAVSDIETEMEPSSVASVPRCVIRMMMDVEWYRGYTIKAANYVTLAGVDIEADKIEPSGTYDGQIDAAEDIDV